MRLLIILLLLAEFDCFPLNHTELPIEFQVISIGDQATNSTVKPNLSKFNYSIIDEDNEIIERNKTMVLKMGGYEVNQNVTVSAITTTTMEITTTEISNPTESAQINPIFATNSNDTENRAIRQDNENNDVETSNNDGEEFEDEEEEEDMNMVTGLISAFLGGLSRPDGSIDLEAITGLLGSLSSQNEDGTYNFNGLTDLLRSFFGGGEDGGGSDFGAFIGGLLGALLKGITNPPGPKGAGIFVGKVATGLLPALSVPPTDDDDGDDSGKPPQLDSGSFLGGLLKTVLGGSSGGGGNATTTPNQGGGSKFPIFKAIFSLITSVFTSSSHSH